MTVADWLGFPPGGPWPGPANAWMNELVDAANLLDAASSDHEARIVALEADITDGTYTPTLTQGGAVTKDVVASYTRVGTRVLGSVLLSVTGAGTGSTNITSSVPLARATAHNLPVGSGYFVDASSGLVYPVIPYLSGPTTLTFLRAAAEGTSVFLGTAGFTAALAAGDLLTFQFSYPTA